MKNKKQVAIVGYGFVGKAYNKMFSDAVIYDEPNKVGSREEVNKCDLALVAVPTNLKNDGTLDMSIVEDVVSWLETPLILFKSALQPGTIDRLVKETGKKIAVSIEMIGEGNYFLPEKYPNPLDPRQHPMLIIGGEEKTATACAEFLWDKMSPGINIQIVTALEAEIGKLIENAYGALKVTWANTMFSLTEKSNTNFIKLHQAFLADSRVDGIHLRTLSWKRGWKSKCWDKDVVALKNYAKTIGANDMFKLLDAVIELNKEHLTKNISQSA